MKKKAIKNYLENVALAYVAEKPCATIKQVEDHLADATKEMVKTCDLRDLKSGQPFIVYIADTIKGLSEKYGNVGAVEMLTRVGL